MNVAFTVEESNLICIYSSEDRQKALDGLYHALSVTEDSAKFASLKLVGAEK